MNSARGSRVALQDSKARRASGQTWTRPALVTAAMALWAACLCLAGCGGGGSSSNSAPAPGPVAGGNPRPSTARGTLQSVTWKISYTQEQAGDLLSNAFPPGFEGQQMIGTGPSSAVAIPAQTAGDGAVAYAIEYWSVDPRGEPVLLSGLLTVPAHPRQGLPLLAYHHGTKSGRNEVASQNPNAVEPACMAALYASNQWAVAMPDYFGMGICTNWVQTYTIDALSTPGCIDMIRASKAALQQLGIQENGQLFATGYSQGAHLTMALVHELQTHPEYGLRVTAAAPMAGSYHVTASDFAGFVHSVDISGGMSSVLALWAYSHSLYYGAPAQLADAFQDRWVDQVPGLLADNVNSQDLSALLATGAPTPLVPSWVLKPEYFDEAAANPQHPFARALAANEQWNWTPGFPMCISYSAEDDMLPPTDSYQTFRGMAARGSPVQAFVTTGGHLDAFARLNLAVFQYFQGLR